ncbi:hypothetical protein Bca52824_093135 [Brassica carinata]|uniref:AMP-dependent synthetase/ligase domain-containing protein n=1 Tax=Brassica carinata TaxID=52824 RepID=A0A8X7P814_BRACI|nr:hypothetical protein Bca52824_093135 [Brassica carinata]
MASLIDSRSGFCKSNSTFYSKRNPLPSRRTLPSTSRLSSPPSLTAAPPPSSTPPPATVYPSPICGSGYGSGHGCQPNGRALAQRAFYFQRLTNMGQDYSYSQPSSSSDSIDITSLLHAEAELYADEGQSSYNNPEPVQYPPQQEADDGIPTICYCGGEPVVATSSTHKDPSRRISFKRECLKETMSLLTRKWRILLLPHLSLTREVASAKQTRLSTPNANPLGLPANPSLDVTTFISSQPHRGTTAFIDAATGHSLSFSDLWRAVDRVAECLHHDVGIRRGDVVLILSPNSIYIPIVCLSVMSLGAVVTTANTLNTAGEISRQIADSNPTLAFTTVQLASKLPVGISIVLTEEERVEPTRGVVGAVSEMMKKEPRGKRVRDRVHQDDTAVMLYSSGTTGPSKGVLSSHGN